MTKGNPSGMKKRFLLFCTALFASHLFFIPLLDACDLCSVYSATNASGQGGMGFNAGVAEQFTHYGTLQDSGSKVPDTVGQYMDSSVTQIFSSYDFNNRVGVQVTVPIIYRVFKRPTTTGVETGTVSGVGDMSIIAKFMPYEKFTENFSFKSHLLAGIKLPTGSTSRLHEELTEMDTDPPSAVHGHDLTLGSGSVDGIIGGNIFTRWHRFLGTADIQYAIRNAGDIGYRFANDLHWGVGLGGYLFLKHSFTLATQLKTSGEHKGLDNLSGVSAGDTGITAVYMGPDFLFTWKQHLSANLGADIPVVLNNTAFQSVPDWRIRTAITWHF